MKYNKPFYELEIKALNCSVEIQVNKIPCFYLYNEVQLATDLPLNMYFLRSGKQRLDIKILPITKPTLNQDVSFEYTLFVKEYDAYYLDKEKLNSVTFPIFKESEGLPQFFHSSGFEVEIPYELNDYEIGDELIDADELRLKSSLLEEYRRFANLVIHDHLSEYNKYTATRFSEISKSHYLTQTKQDYYKNKSLGIFKDLDLKLIEGDYELCYYGENKLVALKALGFSPGLLLNDQVKDNVFFTEGALYYRKDDKWVLYR